ncbi:MAG: phosphoserine transaminase [Alphaproteobacteria bacterium]|nr:phosphoserine transaminase [Alphaproteobacteria bacterium]
MDPLLRPDTRPKNPLFSSGPCAKRPGWTTDVLKDACLGRSHRSGPAKKKLVSVIEKSRSLLGLPEDYRLAIVPASDTGAVEMALWSLLGPRGVDVLVWESFGAGWAADVSRQLRLSDLRILEAAYGELPDLSQVDFSRDVVFTWNGTTSGVCVPDGNWIPSKREGLTICDATSAVFAMDVAWEKLDVATYSWQKVMGGEGQHGMLILSPRAVHRLSTYTPPWPLPKIFRLTSSGTLIEGLFSGATINTPSMLAVEDALDGLAWAESIGGLPTLMARSQSNLEAITSWVEKIDWVDFLVADPNIRSRTSVCLKINDSHLAAIKEDPVEIIDSMVRSLETECVAFDIGAYREAPPGLRLWAGATVERSDLESLFPWLDWSFETVRRVLSGKE